MAKDNRGRAGGSTGQGEEGFLGRWSRRKTEARLPAAGADLPSARAGGEPGSQLPAAAIDQPGQRPAAEPDTDQTTQLPAAELPDIDQMGAGSDFSVFMQAGVPPALKTKALRKLWRVKPELANLDGLLDYGEDLTGSFKVMDHLKTAYQVGRGFLRDHKNDEPAETEAPKEDDAAEAPTLADDAAEPAGIGRTADGDEPQPDVIEGGLPQEEPAKG